MRYEREAVGAQAVEEPHRLSFELRQQLSDLCIVVDCVGGSFKSQIRRADKADAALAVILGEDEITRNVAAVKEMQKSGEQIEVP